MKKVSVIMLYILVALTHGEIAIADQLTTEAANQKMKLLLQKMPVKVAAELNNKIIIRVLESKNIDTKKTMSDQIHEVSSVQEWSVGSEKKWIININSGIKNKEFVDRVLLHQMIHVYDDMGILVVRNDQERKIVQNCSYTKYYAGDSLPKSCKILNKWKKTVSDHNDFLERIYREEIPAEAFAGRFSDYILDNNFSCREPGLNAFFTARLGEIAYKRNADCSINYTIPNFEINPEQKDSDPMAKDGKSDETVEIKVDTEPLILDPQKIYRIDYLLASEGGGMESSMGHTMFRIVVCAPYREEVSVACEQDTAFHIAIGFAAFQRIDNNTETGLKGYWDGMIGNSPSVLSIVPLSNMMKIYNVGEDRALKAYPINFSRQELKNFIYQTLDSYWNHNRNYYFLTNNCASEGFALIKRSLNRPFNKIYDWDVNIVTPKRLLEKLIDAKLILPIRNQDKKSETYGQYRLNDKRAYIYEPDLKMDRHVHYFPSLLEIALENIPEEQKELYELNSSQLRIHFDNTVENEVDKYNLARDFRAIEKHRFYRLRQKYQTWMQNQLMRATDDELVSKRLKIEKSTLNIMRKLNLRHRNTDKGIPMSDELQKEMDLLNKSQREAYQELEKLAEVIKNKSFSDMFPDKKEMETTKNNLLFYETIVGKKIFNAVAN